MLKFRTRSLSHSVSLATFALLTSLVSPALACGGEWYPALMEREPDQRPRLIPLAEKALDDGKPVEAAGLIVRVIPHIQSLQVGRAKIVDRAIRVLAVTLARHSGALALEREVPDYAQGSWLGKTEKDRSRNLHWAVSTLGALAHEKQDDPASETELAEAMATLPEFQAQAQQKLEALAAKDLVASAEGYAALAKLRARSGDLSGERLALSRCQAMAKAARTCGASESAS